MWGNFSKFPHTPSNFHPNIGQINRGSLCLVLFFRAKMGKYENRRIDTAESPQGPPRPCGLHKDCFASNNARCLKSSQTCRGRRPRRPVVKSFRHLIRRLSLQRATNGRPYYVVTTKTLYPIKVLCVILSEENRKAIFEAEVCADEACRVEQTAKGGISFGVLLSCHMIVTFLCT